MRGRSRAFAGRSRSAGSAGDSQSRPSSSQRRTVSSDNLIFHPVEPCAAALIDWELSTLGDALVDFAYHTLTWILRSDEFRGMANADLPALGIPSADSYLALYAKRDGMGAIDPALWSYHLVFGLFCLAAILQGIAKRAEGGNASSADALETGAKARPIAELAWRKARDWLDAR